MTKRRKLTREERSYVERGIKSIEIDIEYTEKSLLPKQKLALECAPIEYKKQIKDIESKLKQYEEEVKEAHNAISTLKDQLLNGVEVKQKKKEEKNANK